MALKVLGRFLETQSVRSIPAEHSTFTIEVEEQSLLEPLSFSNHCLC